MGLAAGPKAQKPRLKTLRCCFDSKQGIIKANGYKELTAVKEGRLFEIDNNMLDRQGPRLAKGLEELAKVLHPEQFK